MNFLIRDIEDNDYDKYINKILKIDNYQLIDEIFSYVINLDNPIWLELSISRFKIKINDESIFEKLFKLIYNNKTFNEYIKISCLLNNLQNKNLQDTIKHKLLDDLLEFSHNSKNIILFKNERNFFKFISIFKFIKDIDVDKTKFIIKNIIDYSLHTKFDKHTFFTHTFKLLHF